MKFLALGLAVLSVMIGCTADDRQNNKLMNKRAINDISEAICSNGGIPLKNVYKIIESNGEQIEQIGFPLINGMRSLGSACDHTNRLSQNLGIVVRDHQGNQFQINLCVDAYFEKDEDIEPVQAKSIIEMVPKIQDYLNHDNTRLKFMITGVRGPFEVSPSRFFVPLK